MQYKAIKAIYIFLSLAFAITTQDSFALFKNSMETHVIDIANNMKKIYGGLCESSAAQTC